MERGEIWWAALPAPHGSGPGSRRPVLIVQSDEFNRSRIRTIMAVMITGNTALAEAPGNVLLQAENSGLPRVSVANVSQVYTLDRVLLTDRVSRLPARMMERVGAGLRLALCL